MSSRESEPLPEGPFAVILADPPWAYRGYTESKHGAAASAYSTMSIEDLEALPVGDLAADDCALAMWATWPKIPEAMRLMKAWGFTYVTGLFVWSKTYPNGRPYLGLGFYTRSGSEFILLGKRGSVPRDKLATGEAQVISAPVGRHSQKPVAFLEAIDRLWPKGRRVELFSRSRWPGWEAWGNQVEDAMPLFEDDDFEDVTEA